MSMSERHKTSIEPQRYMTSDVFLSDSINFATDVNPKSVEFLYLPSGEILAQPQSVVGGAIPPPLQLGSANYATSLKSGYDSLTRSMHETASHSVAQPGTAVSRRGSTKMTPHQQRILELETLLQNEKKRSLDKMRLLLDEQDKSHDLQTRFAALQAKVSSFESTSTRQIAHIEELKASLAASEARNASLVADLAQKSNQIDRLAEDVAEKSVQIAVLQASPQASITQTSSTQTSSPKASPNSNAASKEPSTTAETQEKSSLTSILQAVRVWKEMADNWCTQSTISQSKTLESLLLEFPSIPSTEDNGVSPGLTTEASAVIAMLKRRLAYVDKEWRQTHSKYVELKELCARQCVREADLQNFVNEHRLRGQCSLRLPSSNTVAAPTPSTALQSPLPDNEITKEQSPRYDESKKPPVPRGHMKVIIKRSHGHETTTTAASSDTSSAIRAKLQTLPRKTSTSPVVVPSSRLAKQHQRTPTPRKKKPSSTTSSGRPWV
ncbi:unnamed protein product [Aphanomyces euteiches]